MSINKSIGAIIVDPDQTARTVFVYEASNSLVDTFRDYAL